MTTVDRLRVEAVRLHLRLVASCDGATTRGSVFFVSRGLCLSSR